MDFTKLQYPQALQAWLNVGTETAAAAAAGTANDATVLAASTTLAATRADTDRAAEADKLKAIHDSYIE